LKSTGEPGFVVLAEAPWEEDWDTTRAAKYLIQRIKEETGNTLMLIPAQQFSKSIGLHSAVTTSTTTRVPLCVGYTPLTKHLFSERTEEDWSLRQEGAAVLLEGKTLANLFHAVDHWVNLVKNATNDQSH